MCLGKGETGEKMVRQARALAALTEEWGLLPSTHMEAQRSPITSVTGDPMHTHVKYNNKINLEKQPRTRMDGTRGMLSTPGCPLASRCTSTQGIHDFSSSQPGAIISALGACLVSYCACAQAVCGSHLGEAGPVSTPLDHSLTALE